MTDAGHAYALMGNHEYNALAYHHRNAEGHSLRPQKGKYLVQHAQTLAQFFYHQEEWQQYLDWFYTLPLFLELDGLRAVHACWDDDNINWLKTQNQQYINPSFLEKAHIKHSHEKLVVEETLKGKEIRINQVWHDKDGHPRSSNRIKWWTSDFASSSFESAIFNCPADMQQLPFVAESIPVPYPAAAPPVFCGHYWLHADSPVIQAPNVACLDYSVAKGGILVAYRWDGESQLLNEKFEWVGQK
jgi:hypothetical protein